MNILINNAVSLFRITNGTREGFIYRCTEEFKRVIVIFMDSIWIVHKGCKSRRTPLISSHNKCNLTKSKNYTSAPVVIQRECGSNFRIRTDEKIFMQQQISQAVAIALDGTSDASLNAQAIEFINSFKATSEGYNCCVEMLGEMLLSNELKFFIFQVIDQHLEDLDAGLVATLDTALFGFLKRAVANSETAFVKNKFLTVYAKVYCRDAPQFFDKWYELLGGGGVADDGGSGSNNYSAEEAGDNFEAVADYFLRVVLAIHAEIGDKLIRRDPGVDQRNTYIKDRMRQQDMKQLIALWLTILTRLLKHGHADNVGNALAVIGAYVQWMDIGLFVDQGFIPVLGELISRSNAQSCTTLMEMISKKMKSHLKLQLVAMVDIHNFNPNTSDINFLEALARLVGRMGYELCAVMEESPQLVSEVVGQRLPPLWPLILEFFSNEYDEVSAETVPFLQQYLGLCKKDSRLVDSELFRTLLVHIIDKLRFDKDVDIDDDELIEEFNEFRAKLKGLQDTIGALAPEVYMTIVPKAIDELLFNTTDTTDWTRFEVGLFEFGTLSDAVKNNILNVPKPEIPMSPPYLAMTQLYVKLVNVKFAEFRHGLVLVNLFEILVKTFGLVGPELKHNLGLVYGLLGIFNSDAGLVNVAEKVRLRCWYQFLRFVKLIKVGFITDETVVDGIWTTIVNSGGLTLSAEITQSDDDIDIYDSGPFTSQLYLFESMGVLLAISDVATDHKTKLMDLVTRPIFQELARAVDGPKDPGAALQVHHQLMALGTFIRGLNHHPKPESLGPQILGAVHNCAQTVVVVLDSAKSSEIVRESARFCFARMIPVLGDTVVPELGRVLSLMVSADLQLLELTDFWALVNQIVHKYQNNQNMYTVLNNLVTPLVSKTLFLVKTTDLNDSNLVRDQNTLKKAFLTFISILVSNHHTSLLVTESNQQLLPQILAKVFELCYDLDNGDIVVNKTAISQLVNLVGIFQNGKVNDDLDKFRTDLAIDGVNEYLVTNAISLSFELPFKLPNKTIINEIAVLLKTLQVKSPEFVGTLLKFLDDRGMHKDMKIGFINKLIELDMKLFKRFFGEFVVSMGR